MITKELKISRSLTVTGVATSETAYTKWGPFRSVQDILGFVQNHPGCRSTIRPVFRGQSDVRYNLIPSLNRTMKEQGRPPSSKMRGKRNAVRDKWKRKFSSMEQSTLLRFRSQSIRLNETIDYTDLEWLTMAQHYSLPTRLLDWSTDLIVALWFAVEGAGSKPKVDAALWIYLPDGDPSGKRMEDGRESDWIDLYDDHWSESEGRFRFLDTIDRTRAVAPRKVNERISNQSGVFTLHRLMPKNGSHDLVALNANIDQKRKVHCLTLASQSKKQILEDIEVLLGTDLARVYPDHAAIAAAVNRQYF